MENKALAFWNKQAKRYDDSERQFDPVYKDIIAKTRAHLSADDLVMDFGCASGSKSFELSGAVKHIHGFDISEEMIKEARKKQKELNILNASFTHGSIFESDFEAAYFHKVISYGVIHLLEESEKVIRKIHELLKPGGLFISTTACLKDKMALKTRLVFSTYLLSRRLGFFPLHLNRFRTGDVEDLISRGNFQIVQAERIFHDMTISFLVARKP